MGGSGSSATNTIGSNAGQIQLNNQPTQITDPKMQALLADYSSGKISLADALKSAQGDTNFAADTGKINQFYNDMWTKRNAGGSDQDFNQANEMLQHMQADQAKKETDARGGQDRMNAIFTDPLTGTKAATDQVMNNEAFKPYIDYGKGLIGQNDKLNGFLGDDRDALSGKGDSYGLTDNDLKAYGQASDSIGRQYASSDQSLAQMLADRGLSQAPSGAAMQAFSGQMGNKNEQLAQMQQQIANSRIQTAKGLAEDRMNADVAQQKTLQGSIQGMGQLSGQAVNDQFNRNMAGVGSYQQQLKDSLAAAQATQNQNNEAFSQVQATKGPTLGDVMGGLATGAAGAFTGGLGGALGAGIGSSMFGSTKPTTTNTGVPGMDAASNGAFSGSLQMPKLGSSYSSR